MEKRYESVNCNLCGLNDYDIVQPARYKDETQADLAIKFRSSGDERLIDRVVKCKNCGLIYVNPRLKPELIVKGYSEGTDELFVSQADGRAKTFERCLNTIEKYKKYGKVLDIGTAGGTFLHVAKKHGWEVYGIEPNKWLCDWGKQKYGIDIKAGTFFDHKYDENSFDVVTLWDVLEHVPDPRNMLTEIHKVLKPSGLLVVNYPDVGSWIAGLMGKRWVFWLSVHLYYFTPKTIREMLKTTGFEVVKIKPHFQTLALGYLAHRMKQYSPTIHRLAALFVNTLNLNDFLIPYWLGQTLVIARKK